MDATRQPPPSTNVHVIDGQHAILLGNIEKLERAMAAGESTAELPQIVRIVADYAERHGPTEERLMALHDYPLRELHRSSTRNSP